MTTSKRNVLTQKEFRQLGDWVLANMATVERLSVAEVAEEASSILGVTVTTANVESACDVVGVLTHKEALQLSSGAINALTGRVGDLNGALRVHAEALADLRARVSALEQSIGAHQVSPGTATEQIAAPLFQAT